MVHSKTTARKVAGAHKQVLAARLRMYGYEYGEIAERVGYSDSQAAYEAVRMAMAKMPQEPVEELKHLELTRLNRLLERAWQRMEKLYKLNGNEIRPKSRGVDPMDPIPVILKIMDRRAKLMGLDAPQRFSILMDEAQRISDETGIPLEQVLEGSREIAKEQARK